MLFLIGGAPRVGKSTLANILLDKNRISYIDTDWLIHMLMYSAPQLGIKTYKNLSLQEFKNKANNFYPFLYQLVKHNQPVLDKYTIEGDAFLPHHVSELRKEFKVSCCFIGTSRLTPKILLENPSKNDWWIKKMNSEALEALCEWVMKTSSYLKKECAIYKVGYFDIAGDQKLELDKAYQFLLKE